MCSVYLMILVVAFYKYRMAASASGDPVPAESRSTLPNTKCQLKWPIRREDYKLLDVVGKTTEGGASL